MLVLMFPGRRPTGKQHAARAWRKIAGKEREECAFAAPARADDRDELAGFYRKIDLLQHRDRGTATRARKGERHAVEVHERLAGFSAHTGLHL